MESIDTFATKLIDSLERDKHASTKIEKISTVVYWTRHYMEDVFKLLKNINDTSLPGSDRTKRIIELETKYGIPKTHIL